jgi:tRNA dimethylallyltransferase
MKKTELKPKIIVVLGPTATGKSDVAVNLAKEFDGEIISADSRQVYKGMDLGSGKITKKEMAGIPHYLLDVVRPSTYFSVAKYQTLTKKIIKDILHKGKTPIICGGTGLYIDSIVKNISIPNVPPNFKLRKELENTPLKKLLEILKKISPNRAKNIDINNKVRLIRAIEIAKVIGEIPELTEKTSEYNFVLIGLDTEDQILKDRIALRLEKRIKLGMIKEIERLHSEGTSWKRLESFGLEYRNTALFLQGKITRKELVDNLNREIWNFVKRQRTWFKRNKEIKWFKPKEDKKILKYIKSKI